MNKLDGGQGVFEGNTGSSTKITLGDGTVTVDDNNLGEDNNEDNAVSNFPGISVFQLGAMTGLGEKTRTDICYDVAVDLNGNMYCVGVTNGSLGGALGGNADIFILKLSKTGDIVWLKQFGAEIFPSAQSEKCNRITVDVLGNLYCAGRTSGFLGEAFGGGQSDAFVMKLNSEGVIQWITQLGAQKTPNRSTGNDECSGVAVDEIGNVYCAGTTSGSLGESNGGNVDVFVLKLNNNGVVQWIKQLGLETMGAASRGGDSCYSVAVDENGNVYCGGVTSLHLGERNGMGLGQADPFIVKLNSSGVLQWIRQLGAISSPGDSTGWDACWDITVDKLSNVYCAGQTNGSLGEENAGNTDAFVMKLNGDGALQWLTQLGAESGTGDNSQADRCNSVVVDSSFNVYCAGGTSGSLGEAHGGESDVFAMKLDSLGAVKWIKQLGADTAPGESSKGESCNGVAVDAQGNVYCAGWTNGSLGEKQAGGGDAFIMKLEF